MKHIEEMRSGFETAFINRNINSNLAYQPEFVSNQPEEGKKVISSIEEELLRCEAFQISVAFITMGGITPLLQTLKELEEKGIPGQILTSNYLNFSEPAALKKLQELKNITLKMYDTEAAGNGFHTKGYIFRKEEIYRIIIGSSNLTGKALTCNREWNTKVISTEEGEMADRILEEFQALWNSEYAKEFDEFYEPYRERYQIIKHQKEVARHDAIPSIEKYTLKPNSMQESFIANLRKLLEEGERKALLISSTGSGKTLASAFAMRELGFKRVLFLVHRGQLAKQTMKSYKRVLPDRVSMGLFGAGYADRDADYIFATVQTLSREEHLKKFDPQDFSCIILDEAHHSAANSYQKIMDYFQPELWLGMTATPDKKDDNLEGRNIYEIFNHNIACDIRLQQAMEENLLCPFHYFGISDLSLVSDGQSKGKTISERNFQILTSEERVKHIVEQAYYYGYSGDRVKGLIFCSRIEESEELSRKLNETINPESGACFRTLALNGSASEEERQEAFERLAMDEKDKEKSGLEPLDYIISVEILNEGVDIVEVNQVLMLRPTQSPIVFIQQLGRGLRKAEGKEYVVILDFIGNYNNNFMIPIALSGDRTYNPDTIRKYVISGNSTLPGSSTIHFDAVAKEKIFQSIDRIRGLKAIIRESYSNLKNRLGRVPYLMDFYENGEVDPLLLIREYKTYQDFLSITEPERYAGKMTEQERLTLEYISKTVLSGVRPYELELLRHLTKEEAISAESFAEEMQEKYPAASQKSIETAVCLLEGDFVSNEKEHSKYQEIEILKAGEKDRLQRLQSYSRRLQHAEFRRQMEDLIQLGLRRYQDKYSKSQENEVPFVLYEKYSRRDVSLLMNCGRDLSSTMYGMKRIGDDVFIFVTYHKMGAESEDKQYAEGKPDYADAFANNMIFRWDSQIGRGADSSYMQEVRGAKRKHLFVKKSDAESSFYYMGDFVILEALADKKLDNNGKIRDITKVTMQMKHAVREDLLRYLESNIAE